MPKKEPAGKYKPGIKSLHPSKSTDLSDFNIRKVLPVKSIPAAFDPIIPMGYEIPMPDTLLQFVLTFIFLFSIGLVMIPLQVL
ncbi:hypothetical protein [uncultured Chryseobacterium sp.]|uniref:hypothetical protein n=1 Tax=uncultured Chryseobacterium sp. TaxID=259322 RepID=UPI0025FD8A2D|nr:hypothetical protein [uncultured Chryseobacterium sp.]